MLTSYFAKEKDLMAAGHVNLVSIALVMPKWFSCHQYLALAPTPALLKWWKGCEQTSEDEAQYINWYKSSVLNRLDPEIVVRDLGPDPALMCYEKTGDFCHRNIVAEWLKMELGIAVEEFSNDKQLNLWR